MKNPMRGSITAFLSFLVVTVSAGVSPAQTPLGTGVTYQGQLKQNGAPMSGTVNARFSLWDAPGSGSPPTGGNQIGSIQQVTNVRINNGLFTVTLNGAGEFGTTGFNGQARWLQVEVCSDSSCGTRTILAPRQPVTPAPFATFSAKPWTQPVAGGSNIAYNGGNVGIGTNTPTATLHVNGNVGVGVANIPVGLTTEIGGSTPIFNLDVNFRQPNHNTSFVGGAIRIDSRSDFSDPLFQFVSRPAGSSTETIIAALTHWGSLGLGTPAPTAKLAPNQANRVRGMDG